MTEMATVSFAKTDAADDGGEAQSMASENPDAGRPITNGINYILCKTDDALHLDTISDFICGCGLDSLFGGANCGACACGDDENTIVTACTDYTAWTDYTSCSDYTAAVTLICFAEDEELSDVARAATYEYDDDDFSAATGLTSRSDVSTKTISEETPDKPNLQSIKEDEQDEGTIAMVGAHETIASDENEEKDDSSSDRSLNHMPYTKKQFKKLCDPDNLPFHFVAIRSDEASLRKVLIPVTIGQPGPLGIVIKNNADGIACVHQVDPSAMEACKGLLPGDLLARPSVADSFIVDLKTAKDPGTHIGFKNIPLCEEKTPPGSDTSLASSRSHRSMPPSPHVEVEVMARILEASSSARENEEVVELKEDECDTKDSVDGLEASQSLTPDIPDIPSSRSEDKSIVTLGGIPPIEAVVVESNTASAVTLSPTSEDIAKVKPPSFESKESRPTDKPNISPPSRVVKSRIVSLDSDQPNIEEDYLKAIAEKNGESKAVKAKKNVEDMSECVVLNGMVSSLLETFNNIQFADILSFTLDNSVDKCNEKGSNTEANFNKTSDTSKANSVELADTAHQSTSSSHAVNEALNKDHTTFTSNIVDDDADMEVLASLHLAKLQKEKDRAASMTEMLMALVTRDNRVRKDATEECQQQEEITDKQASGELLRNDSSGRLACNCIGDQTEIEEGEVVSSGSNSSIKFHVTVSKGLKKSRSHHKKKETFRCGEVLLATKDTTFAANDVDGCDGMESFVPHHLPKSQKEKHRTASKGIKKSRAHHKKK